MISKRARELFEWISKDGEKAIDQLISDRKAEELFLDFKLSSNRGNSNNLTADDRKNYDRAISGFGNSEGGILIWGVDSKSIDRGESIDQCKFPLKDAIRFVRNLNHIGSGRTVPPHSEIENHEVIAGNNNEGYVISHIPKCNIAPIQTVSRDFLVRIGSNFEKASYSYLASQFGKRPEPVIFIMYIVSAPVLERDGLLSFSVGLNIFNGGTNHLRNTYINIRIFEAMGDERVATRCLDYTNWFNYSQLGRLNTFVSKDDFYIAPNSCIAPIDLLFFIKDPIDEGIKIELSYGCEGSQLYHAVIENDKERIKDIYDSRIAPIIRNNSGSISMTDEAKKELSQALEELVPLPKEFSTMTSYLDVNKALGH